MALEKALRVDAIERAAGVTLARVDREGITHLEMKVGEILPGTLPHRADNLPP
ncbi:MAG: hypothetical protein ACC661_04090 [Verrucomicrobiales bacterium]